VRFSELVLSRDELCPNVGHAELRRPAWEATNLFSDICSAYRQTRSARSLVRSDKIRLAGAVWR
jgi:hypothetical protein